VVGAARQQAACAARGVGRTSFIVLAPRVAREGLRPETVSVCEAAKGPVTWPSLTACASSAVWLRLSDVA